MSDWPLVTLDQLGTVERGRSRHRPRNDPALYGGDYPFFQTGDVKAAEFHMRDHTQTYNEMGLAQSRLWEAGTLCITIAANIAESAVLGIPGCFPDSVVGFTATPSASDVRYVKYLLDHTKLRMQAISRGTTQDNLSLDKLLSLKFAVPTLDVQQKIATVLAAYDELIENNLRRIEILEEMAQAVYREWFVNFRFPGHEDVSLVESPLGPIPEGWSAGTFGDLAENQRVNVNPLDSPGEQFDHFSFAAFDEGRLPSTELGETMKSGKLLVERDSVLLAKLNPRIPRVWFARPGGVRRSVASSEFLVLTSRTGSALELLYAICGDPSFQSRLATMSGGTSTSHQRLKLDDLMGFPIPIASEEVVEAFVDATRPMNRLVANLRKQNENLRSTRDLLLPKLVSGEIGVSEVEIDTEWLAS